MSIIENNDQICLAYSGETYYDNCGGLLQETGRFLSRRKLVLTDGQIDPLEADDKLRNAAKGIPHIIYLEDCETTSITYPCNEPVSTIDEGKFVEIVNTCTEPITVTGMKNSDPSRFTIFDLEYRGFEFYHSGICEDLPFTVAPYTKKVIHSFFHPTRVEIEDGNAGSYENRTGDAWSAKISMYPGFPIIGCEEMDPCDSFYTLSGELLCTYLDREPLKNIENYQGLYGCTGELFGGLEASDCLTTSGVYTDTFNPGSDEYIVMQNLAEAVEGEYAPYGSNAGDPPDSSMYISANCFMHAIFKARDFDSLLNEPAISIQNIWRKADDTVGTDPLKITGSYLGENFVINHGDEPYTGMRFLIGCDDSGPFVSDTVIFFNTEVLPDGKIQPAIFISEWGDFNDTKFCFSRSDVELATNPYSPPIDIKIWSSERSIIGSLGEEVTEITEDKTSFRVGYLHGFK